MNKGLKAYLKLGMRVSKRVIKERKVSRFKFYFLWLATLLSYIMILPSPSFIQANIRMDKQNADSFTYDLTKIFVDTDSPKAFWTSLMALLIKIVLFVSGIVLIGLVAFLLYYFGGLLGQITGVAMLMYLLPIPALIGLLVFVFGFRLMFMPLFYYLNNDNSLSITKAFNASVRTMREQGKGTMFFIDFIHLFINGAYIGLAVFVSMFLLGQDVEAMKIIGVIAIILFLVIYILFASRLGIAHRVAKLKLLEDIMIDPNLAENPQLVKEKMIKQGLSKDEFLVKLFDKNQEEALEADKEEKEDKQENK